MRQRALPLFPSRGKPRACADCTLQLTIRATLTKPRRFRPTANMCRSGVPKPTISAFEVKDEGARLTTMNNRAVVDAFERAGIEFIPSNGRGAGLRLREPEALPKGG